MSHHEPLHPETAATLRQLIKLHGSTKLIEAIHAISKDELLQRIAPAQWAREAEERKRQTGK